MLLAGQAQAFESVVGVVDVVADRFEIFTGRRGDRVVVIDQQQGVPLLEGAHRGRSWKCANTIAAPPPMSGEGETAYC